RTARVTEAGATGATARIQREFQEPITVCEIARDQFTGCKEADSKSPPNWRATANILFLNTIAYEVDARFVRQRIHQTFIWQYSILADDFHRDRLCQDDNADITRRKGRP